MRLFPTADSAFVPLEDLFADYEVERSGRAGRPWVVGNMVAGLDGSLSWHGRVGSLSGPADRALFVRLRGLADAVLVGAATVRAEGYGPVKLPDEVRRRREGDGRSPVPPLVVVSRSLELGWDGPLWAGDDGPRPIVVTGSGAPPEALATARRHADVIVAGDEGVVMARALEALAERGMGVVLTEGGPTLLDELVDAGALDELCLTLAPVFGGDPLTMAHRALPSPALTPFALQGVIHHEGELFLRYTVATDEERP